MNQRDGLRAICLRHCLFNIDVEAKKELDRCTSGISDACMVGIPTIRITLNKDLYISSVLTIAKCLRLMDFSVEENDLDSYEIVISVL